MRMHTRVSQGLGNVGLGAVLVSVLACTNADLMVAAKPEVAVPRLSLAATTCVPEPIAELAPYKVLFVIDTSYSNSWTDPAPPDGRPRREQAVRRFIEEQIPNPNVSFGVITFSDQPKRQTFGYTRDLVVLNGAVANIGQAQGGTNYADTMWVVTDFIQADLRGLSAVEALRTHYVVFWLSDGFPTVSVVDPLALVPGVDGLAAALDGEVAEFRFHTAFLGGGGAMVPAAEQERAKDLLREMAAAGDGEFTDIAGDQTVVFAIDMQPILRRFVLAGAVALNHQLLLADERVLPDSDADGLLDADEEDLALDPTLADSDGDGLSDLVELGLALEIEEELLPGGRHDPLTYDQGCADPGLDTDQDTLSDCDELLLGTDPRSPDTDGDLLPDPVEVRLGASPLKREPTGDTDLDLMTDEEEVRRHLDPNQPTASREAERWGYRYLVTPLGEAEGLPPSCYEIVVHNLAVLETLETENHAAGVNRFEVWAVFQPEDGVVPTLFRRAEVSVRYLSELDILSPAAGRVTLEDLDFATLPSGALSADP